MVLVMKLASGRVAMLKMNATNHHSKVAALKQLLRRSFSSERSLLTGERISQNLELLRAQKTDNTHIAVLFVWMNARRAHLENYFRFYLDNGFDVLWVTTKALQLFAPTSKNGAQNTAREVLNYLIAEKNRCYQNMMLHSFSIGGYQWGECLVEMRRDPKKYETVEKIMKAQVYDSCVDLEGIPSGFPAAVTRSKALRFLGKMGLHAYLTLAYPYATRHYENSSIHFRQKPVNVPTLYFNSLVDKVSCPRIDQGVVEGWRSLGLDVKHVIFSDSKHVQHLGKHPDRYTDELVALMNKTMPSRGEWTGDQVKAAIRARQSAPKVG